MATITEARITSTSVTLSGLIRAHVTRQGIENLERETPGIEVSGGFLLHHGR